MKNLPFKKLDAFATVSSGGNPAGMISLNSTDDLSPEEMLRIARELEGFVTEVGYVNQRNEQTFDLKYYSAEKEVAFCGHATIAIAFELFSSVEGLKHKKQIFINTAKGKLVVENRIAEDSAVFISAPIPVFSKNVPELSAISEALKTTPEVLTTGVPAAVINAGLETLVVPVRSLDDMLALAPDLDRLKAFCIEHAIDIVALHTADVAYQANRLRSRVFAPVFGYLEDPATGSGNCAIAYQLLKHKQWDGRYISLEQNDSRIRPNIIKLGTKASGSGKPGVIFGGGALLRVSGEYHLH